MIAPLLRTDQKHARTKTVLGGAGQSSMFAPSKQPRKQECSICPHLPHSIVNAIGTAHLRVRAIRSQHLLMFT